jgi:hypothetical protein
MAIRTDWRIGKKGHSCAGCGTAFPYDTPFHSAIWLEKEEFLRRDLCAACFAAAPSPPFSQWTAVLPKPEPKARVFDLGLAAEFLRRLAAEGGEGRGALAHLLALLLVRKRLVKITDLPSKDGTPRARVEFHDGREPLEIPAPRLSEDDVPSLREELGRLLDLGNEPTPAAPEARP